VPFQHQSAKWSTNKLHLFQSLSSSHFDVSTSDQIETREDTSTGNTSENVGTSTLHQGHETFILQDLDTTVKGGFVVNTSSGGHHHTTTDGINWVRSKTRNNGNTPSQKEGGQETRVVSQKHWFESIVKTEVKTSVDEDTNTGDNETSVKTTNTVRGKSLLVDVNETIVLSGTILGFGVVSKSSTSVIQRVDDGQGHGTSETTGSDVSGEFDGVRGIFAGGEKSFDLSFEGEVQGLGWEISDNIGQVTSPESTNTFSSKSSFGAVENTSVGTIKSALFDHFTLILDKKLDSLNGGSGSLGDTSCDTGEHKILKESQLLAHFGETRSVRQSKSDSKMG